MSELGLEETWRADAAEQRVCELQHEIAVMRGAMARLCRAVSRRMMLDEPEPEDRLELLEAWTHARGILENPSFPTTKVRDASHHATNNSEG